MAKKPSMGKVLHHNVARLAAKKTFSQLKELLPDHLITGYGVIQKLGEARKKNEIYRRYMANVDEILQAKCGIRFCVSNQLTVGRLSNIKKHFRENNLKFEIPKV